MTDTELLMLCILLGAIALFILPELLIKKPNPDMERLRGYKAACEAMAEGEDPLYLYAQAAGGEDPFDYGWCNAIEDAHPEIAEQYGDNG